MLGSSVSRGTRIEEVIRAAGRRHLFVLAIEQFALALATVLGGAILLLLLGTQILAWHWLAILGIAGLAIAALRVRARAISRYRVAQLLDRRLGLSDSLSTAWFLLSHAERRGDALAGLQIERAETLAASVKPVRVFPLRGGRIWSLAAGLAAVAFGLFAVRYLVTDSLNLQHSLISLNFAEVFERVDKSLSAERQPLTQEAALNGLDQTRQDVAEPGQDGRDVKSQNAPAAQAGKPGDGTGAQSRQQGSADKQEASSGKSTNTRGDDAEQSSSSDTKRSEASNGQGENRQPSSNESSGSRQDAASREQASDRQQSSNGLMDKVKDALSSLMAKMQPNASSRKMAQNSQRESQSQRQTSGEQNSAGKGQGEQSQDARENQMGEQETAAEGQGQQQTAEKTRASAGRNSDPSADQKSADSHSGVGRQNGDKSLQEAEQLRAMGKLAEIIGKRSASLTGEVTVETPSGKQQLRTAYSQKLGRHSDTGGEINHDEIPLEDQQYVREYMERVHNQANPQ